MIRRNDLSLAAVRLLALYLVIQAFRNAAPMYALWRANSPPEDSGLGVWIVFAAVAPLVVGAALAVFSRSVARWVAPGADEGAESTPGIAVLQSVAIGTFGLFLIAVDLPRLVSNVLSLSARNGAFRTSYRLLEDPLFLRSAVSVGIALCVGAPFWSRLITAFRGLGGAGPSGRAT